MNYQDYVCCNAENNVICSNNFFRIGFIVDRELLNDRAEISARCEYLGHISEILIVPIKNDKELEGSPVMEVSTEWPYVGQELNMNCTFHTRDGFRYVLTWKCPQCKDKTVCCLYNLLISAAICSMKEFLKVFVLSRF